MRRLKLLVKNIYCSWCARVIKSDLSKQQGVSKVDIKIDKDTQLITLIYKNKIKRDEIIQILNSRGIEVLNKIG